MKLKTLTFGVILLGTMAAVAAQAPAGQAPAGQAPGGRAGGGEGRRGGGRGPQGPGLALTTASFQDGGEIPAKYVGAMGVSPKLDWANVPMGTVTFALIMHDPDVALQRKLDDVLHWMAFNIPGTATSLPDAGSSRSFIALSRAAGGVLGGLLLGAVTGLVARELRPWVDEEHWSLHGKVCAVTGANSGIGQEVALGLARLGGAVVLLCRRPEEGDRVRRFILARHPDADVSTVTCDVGDFASIRRAAARILDERQRLDVLVHNAGALFPQRTKSVDGIEATLAVDVVGPFLLTALVRKRLERSHGRVITLTGIYQRKGEVDTNDLHFHQRPYNWLAANSQAQRGRWLFTSELARRAPQLMTAAVHPGAVLTGAQARLPPMLRVLIHTLARPGFVRAEVGAIPVVRLAAHPELQHVTGHFFDRCHLEPDAADPATAERFWAACEVMTGQRDPSRARLAAITDA